MSKHFKMLIPTPVLAYLERTSLRKGAAPQGYYECLASVIDATRPKDQFECLFALRFADIIWRVQRLRCLRTEMLDNLPKRSLDVPGEMNVRLAAKSVDNNNSKHREFDLESPPPLADPRGLVKIEIDYNIDSAPSIEMLDRRIRRWERRCDAMIRLLNDLRTGFGNRVRETRLRIIAQVLASS